MSCDICIGASAGDFVIEFDGVKQIDNHGGCVCCECQKSIPDGELCLFPTSDFCDSTGLNCEGPDSIGGCCCKKLKSFSTCLVCANIRQVYSCGEGELWGGLWEQMDDWWDDFTMAGECWQQLSAASKAEMVRRWQEHKGLDRLEVGK